MKNYFLLFVLSLTTICVVSTSCSSNPQISEEQRMAEEAVLKDVREYYANDISACNVVNTVASYVEYEAKYDTLYHVAYAYFPVAWSIVADYFDVDSLGVQRRDFPAHTVYDVEYEITWHGEKYKGQKEAIICNGELYYPDYNFSKYCWDHPVMDHVIPCHRRYVPDNGAGSEIGKWQSATSLSIDPSFCKFKFYE